MDFIKIAPTEIDILPPLAVKYLEQAIKRTPASTSRLDITLDIARKGYGNIYLIFDGAILMGATYLVVYPTDKGKVLGIILLGGTKIKRWKDDYYKFATSFGRNVGAYKINYIGRDGWGPVFPMCKRVGSIFELTL